MYLKHLLITALLGISIESIQAATDHSTLKTGMDAQEPQTIEVDSVKVENLAGHVQIKTGGSGKSVTVQMIGDPKILGQVLVNKNNGELQIACDHSASILRDIDSLKLIVTMPTQMPLTLTLVGGKGEVEHREADTNANLNGYGDITLKSVKNFKSEIRGSGEIIVNRIEGSADIAIRGDGKLIILEGSISDLKKINEGTGIIDIKKNVQVQNANPKSDESPRM